MACYCYSKDPIPHPSQESKCLQARIKHMYAIEPIMFFPKICAR